MFKERNKKLHDEWINEWINEWMNEWMSEYDLSDAVTETVAGALYTVQ